MKPSDVASGIASRLVESAYRDGDECTWVGRVQHGGGPGRRAIFSVESLGADVYGGAAGVALFLSAWGARSGDRDAAATATAAMRYALARIERPPVKFRRGFYSGQLGIAYSAVRVALDTGATELIETARPLLDALAVDIANDGLLDVMSGDASAVPLWLSLASTLDEPRYRAAAIVAAQRIVAGAEPRDGVWVWGNDAVGFDAKGPLTGYAHGASGLGVALLEAAQHDPDPRFTTGASGAFAYERTVFDPLVDNWPDLRFRPREATPANYGMAWCVGAPGIGLSRLRALELTRENATAATTEVEAAIRAITVRMDTTEELAASDYTLCHGWTGLGETLLEAHRAGFAGTEPLLDRIIDEGASAHGGNASGWPCGIASGSTPNLMLGLAGIGYFYLRIAAPEVTSIVLPRGA